MINVEGNESDKQLARTMAEEIFHANYEGRVSHETYVAEMSKLYSENQKAVEKFAKRNGYEAELAQDPNLATEEWLIDRFRKFAANELQGVERGAFMRVLDNFVDYFQQLTGTKMTRREAYEIVSRSLSRARGEEIGSVSESAEESVGGAKPGGITRSFSGPPCISLRATSYWMNWRLT